MGIVRSGIIGLLCIAVVALAASALAGSDRDSGRRGESTEALFGGYHCGLGLEGGYAWIGAQGTGDVTDGNLYVTRPIGVGGSPAASCDALAAGAMRLAHARGCTTGPIQARDDDDGGASRDFPFVCHAGRSHLVETLAEFGRHVLTVTP